MLNQYILSQLKPIKPDELNATFRKILSDHGITGRTGTIYYNKSISQHSDQSSAIPRTAYNTPRYIVDITQNIKVQAWVNYDFKTILRHIDNTLFWLIGQLMILIFILIFLKRKGYSNTPYPYEHRHGETRVVYRKQKVQHSEIRPHFTKYAL